MVLPRLTSGRPKGQNEILAGCVGQQEMGFVASKFSWFNYILVPFGVPGTGLPPDDDSNEFPSRAMID
jgi:hypothetical protein